MKKEPRYYSLIEVTALLKVGYSPLLRLIKQGKLDAVKVGASWRVSETELKRLTKA